MPNPAPLPLIDADTGMRLLRCDERLYVSLLASFQNDPSFSRLEAALLCGRRQEAYLAAHTLKGLSAQLALPRLAQHAQLLCRRLCGKDDAEIDLSGLRSAYLDTLTAIRRLIEPAGECL